MQQRIHAQETLSRKARRTVGCLLSLMAARPAHLKELSVQGVQHLPTVMHGLHVTPRGARNRVSVELT